MLFIFDWDGTLSNSLDRIAESLGNAFLDNGVVVPSIAQRKSIVGLGLREAFIALHPSLQENQLLSLAESYREHYLRLDTQNPSPLFEGAMNVLMALKESGHELAVATGKSRRGLDRILTHMGLEDFFRSSRCADETRSKPHPLMLQEILVETSMTPEESVMVGDTDFDILMAKAARVKAIGVTYGAHSLERLENASADVLINQLSELLD